MTSEWQCIYKGGARGTYWTVRDDDEEYVSEHWFRVRAFLSGVWTSAWSEPASFLIDLSTTGADASKANKRFERLLHSAATQCAKARGDALSSAELERLAATLEQRC